MDNIAKAFVAYIDADIALTTANTLGPLLGSPASSVLYAVFPEKTPTGPWMTYEIDSAGRKDGTNKSKFLVNVIMTIYNKRDGLDLYPIARRLRELLNSKTITATTGSIRRFLQQDDNGVDYDDYRESYFLDVTFSALVTLWDVFGR